MRRRQGRVRAAAAARAAPQGRRAGGRRRRRHRRRRARPRARGRRAQAHAARLAPAATPRRTGHTDITKATALPNGIALPPLEAPEEVKQIIEAGNIIARSPYVWGGGHGKWLDTGYDCSGSVSFALAAAGLLDGPLASGPADGLGRAGQGQVGDDLHAPRPRVHGGRRHPVRHLRPSGSPARAGRTRHDDRAGSSPAIPPVSKGPNPMQRRRGAPML